MLKYRKSYKEKNKKSHNNKMMYYNPEVVNYRGNQSYKYFPVYPYQGLFNCYPNIIDQNFINQIPMYLNNFEYPQYSNSYRDKWGLQPRVSPFMNRISKYNYCGINDINFSQLNINDTTSDYMNNSKNIENIERLSQDNHTNWNRNQEKEGYYETRYIKEKKVKRCGVIFIISSSEVEDCKILVVKGVSGIWSLPKGRSIPNEEDDKCAMREVYEETGIKLDNLNEQRRFKIGTNIYYKYICVENQFTEFHIHDTNEVEEVSWKTIKELRNMNCNKDIRSLLNYKTKRYAYHNHLFNF
jgi:8-oxo-dGTP pyrophosphatase MutT (NUDIX family)